MQRPELNLTSLPELEGILARNERPTPAQLHEFRVHAENLFKTPEPGMGWVVLSALAAAQWNVEEVRSVISRGLRAVGEHPQLLSNFAITLEHLELFEEALPYAERAHHGDPLSVQWMSVYTSQLFSLGRISAVSEVLKAYLQRNDEPLVRKMLEENETVRVGLEEAKVSENQVERELAIARTVLRANRIRTATFELGHDDDPESGEPTVVAILQFVGTLGEEMQLGSELAARLADLPDWNPCKLNVDFQYLPQFEDAHVPA